MSQLSTLRVGGPAEAVIYPTSQAELTALAAGLGHFDVPWRVIGRGSNILVSDAGIIGVVVVLGRDFAKIQRRAQGNILVEAGCSLAKLTAWCARQGLSGLEFAVGIPGSVGGAVNMNAGAWGQSMADVIAAVWLMNHRGEKYERLLHKDDFIYRAWLGAPDEVIMAAEFNLRSGSRHEIMAKGQRLLGQRQVKQPKGVASAGSFFKNPPGDAAGRLIEQAGLKGLAIGGAKVSQVHANFLINTGQARAQDFFDLMRLVQERVLAYSGVFLEPEVEFL